MASDQRWMGEEVRQPIAGLVSIFPDMHRELVKVYSTADGVVIVELRLQGTQAADFPVPGGVTPSNGRAFDVPCCDVFPSRAARLYRSIATTCSRSGSRN